MELITSLLQNQPLAPTAPTLTQIPTTSTSTEMQALLKAIGKDKPPHTLTSTTFKPNSRKSWCYLVKSKMKV